MSGAMISLLGRGNPAPSVTFNKETGAQEVSNPTYASWSITASQDVVWTYTKSSAVGASRVSGTSGTNVSFDLGLGAGGASRTGFVNLQAFLGGVSVGSWSIQLGAGEAA
jgi:hypothetical protein